MVTLDRVTVICIDTLNHGAATIALRKTLMEIKPKSCKFLTNVDIKIDGVETVIIPTISSVDEYSRFCIKELYKYFDTDFVLLIQHDGYVLSGDCFDERLYDYDYCGALWNEKDGLNNGNGGFSFRSWGLCNTLANDPVIEITTPEDVSICRIYRRYLEGVYGFKWATNEIAEKFSYELLEPNQKTFGFHGYFHKPYKETVVIQRQAALGDVVQVEPVLDWFNSNGYRVVLATLPQFKDLFRQHRFKVDFYDEIDLSRLNYKVINLDMSYESKPDQLHLKTYYEFSGIENGKIKDPILNLHADYKNSFKLFKKYCVLHIYAREQPYRNIYGIDWVKTVEYLKSLGYTVIQLGNDESSHIPNAIQMKTPTTQFLMWVIASSDLMIGIDSGISHIASGFNIPSIIFFGSVNPKYIHPDLSNKLVITNHDGVGVCNTPYCWHNNMGCVGQECIVNKDNPPCVYFDTETVLAKINCFIKEKCVS